MALAASRRWSDLIRPPVLLRLWPATRRSVNDDAAPATFVGSAASAGGACAGCEANQDPTQDRVRVEQGSASVCVRSGGPCPDLKADSHTCSIVALLEMRFEGRETLGPQHM